MLLFSSSSLYSLISFQLQNEKSCLLTLLQSGKGRVGRFLQHQAEDIRVLVPDYLDGGNRVNGALHIEREGRPYKPKQAPSSLKTRY